MRLNLSKPLRSLDGIIKYFYFILFYFKLCVRIILPNANKSAHTMSTIIIRQTDR